MCPFSERMHSVFLPFGKLHHEGEVSAAALGYDAAAVFEHAVVAVEPVKHGKRFAFGFEHAAGGEFLLFAARA